MEPMLAMVVSNRLATTQMCSFKFLEVCTGKESWSRSRAITAWLIEQAPTEGHVGSLGVLVCGSERSLSNGLYL